MHNKSAMQKERLTSDRGPFLYSITLDLTNFESSKDRSEEAHKCFYKAMPS